MDTQSLDAWPIEWNEPLSMVSTIDRFYEMTELYSFVCSVCGKRYDTKNALSTKCKTCSADSNSAGRAQE